MDNSKRRKLTLYSLIVGMLMVIAGLFSYGVYALSNLNINTSGRLIYADNKVCYIAGTAGSYDKYYDSLEKALADANSADVICVFRAVGSSLFTKNIVIDKNVTIKAVESDVTVDLGSYNITINSGVAVTLGESDATLTNPKVLTLQGAYSVTIGDDEVLPGSGLITNNGTLTITASSKVVNTYTPGEDEDALNAISILNCGTTNVNGEVVCAGGITILDENATSSGGLNVGENSNISGNMAICMVGAVQKLNVSGGKIAGTSNGIYCFSVQESTISNAEVTISGSAKISSQTEGSGFGIGIGVNGEINLTIKDTPTIIGGNSMDETSAAVLVSKGENLTMNISGGTFTSFLNIGGVTKECNVTITGGTFNDQITCPFLVGGEITKVKITGGEFKSDVICLEWTGDVVLDISGGVFDKAVGVNALKYDSTREPNKISGGTFKNGVSFYRADAIITGGTFENFVDEEKGTSCAVDCTEGSVTIGSLESNKIKIGTCKTGAGSSYFILDGHSSIEKIELDSDSTSSVVSKSQPIKITDDYVNDQSTVPELDFALRGSLEYIAYYTGEKDADASVFSSKYISANGKYIQTKQFTATILGLGSLSGTTVSYYAESSDQTKTLDTNARVGYTHSGYTVAWSDTNHSDTLPTATTTTLSIPAKAYGNVTLTPTWTINTYTVTFNANDGSVTPTTKTVTYGQTYTDLPTPTKYGYTFKGWYYDIPTNGYVNYGRDYMYTDKLSIHVEGYMNDWSNMTRLISCTELGGYNIENTNGNINYVVYVALTSGGAGYYSATSTTAWSSLSSGWHSFDLIYDGSYTYGYLDGVQIVKSAEAKGKIRYNTTNSIFVGAEATSSSTTPDQQLNGYVGNVVISNSATLITSTANSLTAPAQNVTLYARWEASDVYNVTKQIGYNGTTNALKLAIDGASDGDTLDILTARTEEETNNVGKSLTLYSSTNVTLTMKKTLNVYGTATFNFGNSQYGLNLTATGNINVAYASDNSVLNIYNGTYTSVSGYSTIAGLGNGTVNLYNGTITGAGSGLYIAGSATLNIYNGTINVTGDWGIYNMSGATGTINIQNGTCASGSAPILMNSNVVCNMSGGTMNGPVEVKGNSKLVLTGGKINGQLSTRADAVTEIGGTTEVVGNVWLADRQTSNHVVLKGTPSFKKIIWADSIYSTDGENVPVWIDSSFTASASSIEFNIAHIDGVKLYVAKFTGTNNAKNISMFQQANWYTVEGDYMVSRQFTITLDQAGGSGATASMTTYYPCTSKDRTVTLTEPTRKGYTFAGWTTSYSSYSSVSGNTLTINKYCVKDLTLTAQWTANTYTVIFNPDCVDSNNKFGIDGTFEQYSTGSALSFANQLGTGGSIAVSDEDAFSGSKSLKYTSGTGSYGRLYENFNAKQGKQYIAEVWVKSSAKKSGALRLEVNGGSYNWSQPYASADLNYTNVGEWQKLTFTTEALTEDATIFVFLYGDSSVAMYADNFTCYEASTTNGSLSKSVTYDSTYGDLPTPSRAGYNFNGWWKDYVDKTSSSIISTLNSTSMRVAFGSDYEDANYIFKKGQRVYLDITYSGSASAINFLDIADKQVGSDCWTTVGDDRIVFDYVVTENMKYCFVDFNYSGTFSVTKVNAFISGTPSIRSDSTVDITENITVKAMWSPATYTVTYNATTNGGSTASQTRKVTYGTSVDLSLTATKSGWNFVGWNTNKDATTKLTSLTMVASAITLYAIYSRTLGLSFIQVDGTNDSKSVTIYNNATSGTITAPAVDTKSDYTIVGWGSSNTATKSAVASGASGVSVTTSTTGTTYYAVYSYTVTVTYNGNNSTGGSTSNSTGTAYITAKENGTSGYNTTNASVTLASNGFTRTGYTFSKWAQCSTSGTQYAAGASISISANTTMYAIWTANTYTNTLNYNANNGTGAPSKQTAKVTYPNTSYTFTLSTTQPTRTDYVFAGWYTDATNGEKITDNYTVGNASTASDQSATIYAHWTAAQVKIDSKYFATLADAVTYANSASGSTLELLVTSLTISSVQTINANMTIKLASGVSSATIKRNVATADFNMFSVSSGKTLTIQGNSSSGLITLDGQGSAGLYSLVANSGTFSASYVKFYNNIAYNTSTNTSIVGKPNVRGGAIHGLDNSTTTLDYCILQSNKANYGGAVELEAGAKVTASNSQFTSNTAYKYGGAFYASGSGDSTFTSCTFTSNATGGASGQEGSAVYTQLTNTTFTSCTFTSHSASYYVICIKAEGQVSNDKFKVAFNSTTISGDQNIYLSNGTTSNGTTYTLNKGLTFNGGTYAKVVVAQTASSYAPVYISAQSTISALTFNNASSALQTKAIEFSSSTVYSAMASTIIGNTTVPSGYGLVGNGSTLINCGKQYTNSLVYDANGGSGAPSKQTVTLTYPNTSHTHTLSSTTPTRTGYTFAGWYTAASGGTKVTGTYKVGSASTAKDQSATLYAHWTANTYTVVYNGNGNTGGSTASSTHTYDVAKNLTANGFTKTGYVFTGWATTASGSKAYDDKATVTNLATSGTFNLYAVWKTVRLYNGSGTSSSNFTQYVASGLGTTVDKIGSIVFTKTKPSDTSKAVNVGYVDGKSITSDIVAYGTVDTSGLYSVTVCTSLENKIYVGGDYANMDSMFREATSLKTLDFGILDTTYVTSLWYTFSGCTSLSSLDLSSLDMTSVTNMAGTFRECGSITSLDLSNFNTSKVKNMSQLFYVCSKLSSITFGNNFDTSKVTNMSDMFSRTGVTELNLSSFNTSSVENMGDMFENCSSLTTLNLSSFDITKVTSYTDMLYGCSKLLTINSPKTLPSSLSSTIALPATYLDSNGTSYTYLPVTTNASITLRRGYTVTFDPQGGTVSPTSKVVGYGLTYGTLPTPTVYSKTGYTVTFKGWYTASSGGSQVTSSTTMGASATTIYAQYTETINNYTLTANAGSGTIPSTTGWSVASGGKTATKSVQYGGTYGTLPTPTVYSKTGYTVTFKGWYTASSGGSQVTLSTTMGASATTIYAQYTEKINSYTVTYNATTNGGAFGCASGYSSTASVNYNSAVDLSTTNRYGTKSSWTFVGWNTNKDATTKLTSLTMDTSAITLYAIYIRQLTLNFIQVDGTNDSESVTIYNTATSGTITAPAVDTKGDYSIVGWGSSNTATTKAVASGASGVSVTTSTTGTTYYAVYSYTVTVVYAGNGSTYGSTSSSYGIAYITATASGTNGYNSKAASITLRSNGFTKTGCTFFKWAWGSADGPQYAAGTTLQLLSGRTMYALWGYTVTLAGNTSGSILVKPGTTISFSVNYLPQFSAYYFSSVTYTACTGGQTTVSLSNSCRCVTINGTKYKASSYSSGTTGLDKTVTSSMTLTFSSS